MTGLKSYLVAYTWGSGDPVKKAARLHASLKEATGTTPTPVMISADNRFSLELITSNADVAEVYAAIAKRLGRDFVLDDRPGADRLLVCEAGLAVASDAAVKAAFAFVSKLQNR